MIDPTTLAPSTQPASLTLDVKHYRGLRSLRWTPRGVCALVGANGSGKSAIASALLFLRSATHLSGNDAAIIAGGFAGMRHCPPPGAPMSERSELSLSDGVTSYVWRITHPPYSRVTNGRGEPVPEILGWATVHESAPFALRHESCTDAFRERMKRVVVQNFVPHELVGGSVCRAPRLRFSVTDGSVCEELAWVDEAMQSLFPTKIGRVGADDDGTPVLSWPGVCGPMYFDGMSRGICRALDVLFAVAHAKPGALVFLDHADEGMHPAVLRRLVGLVRARAKTKGLDVVFATHSPVLISEFDDDPQNVWVMDSSGAGDDGPDGACPRIERLTDLRDEAWLANFLLGDLYGGGFGRQDPE